MCYVTFSSFLAFYLFIYLGFYVAFNTVQVISRWVVGRAEETSTYSSLGLCTVNCRPTASNYQLSHLRPWRGSNPGLRGGRREFYHSATVAPHSTPIRKSLHWLPTMHHSVSKMALLVYKFLHSGYPKYFELFLKPRHSVYRTWRSQSNGVLFDVPPFASIYKSKKHFGLSFAYDAPRIWNDLPDDILTAKSLSLHSGRSWQPIPLQKLIHLSFFPVLFQSFSVVPTPAMPRIWRLWSLISGIMHIRVCQ